MLRRETFRCNEASIFLGGGGRGVLPYIFKPYRYVPPQRVWFCHLFVLKTGIDFAHFGLESGMVCEGTMGAHEPIYHLNSIPNKYNVVTK